MNKLETRIENLEKQIEEIKLAIVGTGVKNITCDKCKYSWMTKSKMKTVSCPSCNGKVSVEKNLNG